jgi:exosortase
MADAASSTVAGDPLFRAARPLLRDNARLAAIVAAGVACLVLFAQPLVNTVQTWWTSPEAGHGLLLAPIALWLAWRRGVRSDARPNVVLGASMLVGSVVLRYLSAVAAEVFIGRVSMFLAIAGLVVYAWGARQLIRWWLPALLLALSVPLPEIIMSSLALPLQLKASRLGAALLAARGVPVRLDGNVIRLPGHDLFVTEACSGLRSLTALLSLGVLLGGTALRYPVSRIVLVALSIPVAVVINGVRVFLTGFLVAFVDPSLAEGFTHLTEGWLLFLVAFAVLGVIAWAARVVERRVGGASSDA